MKNVLIIDNQPISRIGIKALININYKDWNLFDAGRLETFLLQNKIIEPALVLLSLDFELYDPDVDQIKRIKKQYPEAAIIILGAMACKDTIFSLFAEGIQGYVSKLETENELLECLDQVVHQRKYISTNHLESLLPNVLDLNSKDTHDNMCVRSIRRKIPPFQV